ncbi:uncharacterized protein LOC113760471 [Coffea eugenioides]|uniref:uncharacterized protein LOC113760471 n=1 Tax=Coffea eugenioides TaxID=49369 RepID=UPI000F608575|nr:uncharacterized protein LOC113760471 [Coffea eugenioides]
MEQEIIPTSKRRKIEETVVNILKNADLETATEYSVRSAAAHQLSTDLSDLAHKCLVRQALESFLLSTATTMLDDVNSNNARKVSVPQKNKDDQELPSCSTGRVICKLSDKRSVAVHDFRGKCLVSIRDYLEKDGKQLFSGKGISLTGRQWSLFRSSFPAIEEAIAKMTSQTRLAVGEKQSAVDLLVGDITSQDIFPDDKNKMETDISNCADAVDPQREVGERNSVALGTNNWMAIPNGRQSLQTELVQVNSFGVMDHQSQGDGEWKHDGLDVNHSVATPSSQGQTLNQRYHPRVDSAATSAFAPGGHMPQHSVASFPQSLVPIMTTRLDGKNYHCWAHQMEFFLKQLKVAHVLKDPCPSISAESMSFEEKYQAKAAVQKWVDDEYICRHYILNSLSDNLFNQYSKKGCSAKELWEELESVYNEDFGTIRSQVNKYIQFQMVDGVSVLEQTHELQRILATIMASGIWMDENFHASVIISKLPPSWKEYRAKLMQEEFLSLTALLHRLEVEEEARYQRNQESFSRNAFMDCSKVQNKSGLRKKETKRLCYSCGKEGHISKYCPEKKFESHGQSNGKENEIIPNVTAAKVEEKFQD